MENNKSQFKRTGVLHDGAECIEIQISHSGDAARYVSTIKFTAKDPEVTRGRWQETIFAQISKNILTWTVTIKHTTIGMK